MVVPYHHESVRLTGRWAMLPDRAVTTAPGSYFEFSFIGKQAVVRFDTLLNHPVLPHLWIQLDGADQIEVVISPYLRVQAQAAGTHICRIVFKSTAERSGRWYAPLTGAVQLLGIQTEQPLALKPDPHPIAEFIGDSITEGISIDVDYHEGTVPPFEIDQLCLPYVNDACATWAWHTANALHLRPCIMGYGSVGVTRAGCGRVPSAPEAYPFCYDGVPFSAQLPPADIVIINHGANDHAASPAQYCAGYSARLDAVRRRSPQAQLVAVSAFCGMHRNALADWIPRYNEAHGTQVAYVDTAGWISPPHYTPCAMDIELLPTV